MNRYRIFTIAGKSLSFRGNLVASVDSSVIATAHGDAWFELVAYENENRQWVTTIAMRNSSVDADEVFEFYITALLVAAEDFLYDFEPAQILPDDLVAHDLSDQCSLAVSADRSYYAAVRALVSRMETHQRRNSKLLNVRDLMMNQPFVKHSSTTTLAKKRLKI